MNDIPMVPTNGRREVFHLGVPFEYVIVYTLKPNGAVLTTPEPLFIHTMVRDGFPVQAQLNIATDPRSTCRDWGSAAMRGPTVAQRIKKKKEYETLVSQSSYIAPTSGVL